MNRRHIFLGTLFVGSILVLSGVLAWPNGISGYSGAASSGGASCGTCHIISSTEKNDNFYLIHNIPAMGYLPNTKYDFTLKMKSKQPRAGFNIKIENSSGLVSGTIANLDTLSRTEEGELVHTYFSNINEGEGIFKFTWTAPKENIDTINIYGVVASLPNDGAIDTLNFIHLTLNPDLTTIIKDQAYVSTEIMSQMNGNEQIDIRYELKETSEVSITLFNELGILVREINLGNVPAGNLNHSLSIKDLRRGIHLLGLIINSKPIVQKIFINK